MKTPIKQKIVISLVMKNISLLVKKGNYVTLLTVYIFVLVSSGLLGQTGNASSSNCFQSLERFDGRTSLFEHTALGTASCELQDAANDLGDSDFLIGGITLYRPERFFDQKNGYDYYRNLHLNNLDLVSQGYLVFFVNYGNYLDGEATFELSLPYGGDFGAITELKRRVIKSRLDATFNTNLSVSVEQAAYAVVTRLTRLLSGEEELNGGLEDLGFVEIQFAEEVIFPVLTPHLSGIPSDLLTANIYDYSALSLDGDELGRFIQPALDQENLSLSVYLTSNTSSESTDQMELVATEYGKASEVFSLWVHVEFEENEYTIYGMAQTNLSQDEALLKLVDYFETENEIDLPAAVESGEETKNLPKSTTACDGKPSTFSEFISGGKYVHGKDWTMYCFFAGDYTENPIPNSFDSTLELHEQTIVGTNCGLADGLLGFGFGIGQIVVGVYGLQKANPFSPLFWIDFTIAVIGEQTAMEAWGMKVQEMKQLGTIFLSIVSLVLKGPNYIQQLIAIEIIKYFQSISGSSALFNASYIAGLILFEVIVEVLTSGSAFAARAAAKIAALGLDAAKASVKLASMGYDNAARLLDISKWNGFSDEIAQGISDFSTLGTRKSTCASIHGQCFVGSTLVLMGGALNAQPIQEIELFDLVESRVFTEEIYREEYIPLASSSDAIDLIEVSGNSSREKGQQFVGEFENEDGHSLEVVRPAHWFGNNETSRENWYYLSMVEIGVEGEYELKKIRPVTPVEEELLNEHGPSQPVTLIVNHKADLLLQIFTSSDTIGVTPEHPFYSESRAGWVPAGDLKPGEEIHTYDGSVTVAKVDTLIGFHPTVYNIEVNKSHNYYVGAEALLVHNSCAVFVKKIISEHPNGGTVRHGKGSQLHGEVDPLSTYIANLPPAKQQSLVTDLEKVTDKVGGVILKKNEAWGALYRADLPTAVRRNPANLRYVDNHVANSAKTFDDVADELPKLGSFDNWVAWNERWHLTDIILDSKVADIVDEFPDAIVGYRGSLVTGQKFNMGNPIPFDPGSYDVDGFIVSDDFAAQFTGSGWRNARDNTTINSISDDLQDNFVASLQGYKHGPGEHPFTFRVWTVQEYLNIVEPAGAKLINP